MKELAGVDQAVKRLLARIVDESLKEKAENLIRQLVSELIKTPGALDELERAIENPETPSPRCITVPKKMSNITSKNRKPNDIWLMAHFCCAIWRWPGIKWFDLHSLEVCEYPATAPFHGLSKTNTEPVCINPSHFKFKDVVEEMVQMCTEAFDDILLSIPERMRRGPPN
ncbi:protein mothers against dpp-like isoform X2 [Adelges cooleyi]|nr:protein mothers against dpp-like isoform X2 [Adelges cooleyi]